MILKKIDDPRMLPALALRKLTGFMCPGTLVIITSPPWTGFRVRTNWSSGGERAHFDIEIFLLISFSFDSSITYCLSLPRLNRLQNTVHVVIADHTTRKIRIAFTDHDDAWIDLQSAAWYGGEWATF